MNALLIEDISISRMLTHAQKVKSYKLKEHGKKKKYVSSRNYVHCQ